MGAMGWAPRGWLPCLGQMLPISDYDQLYAVIGKCYGSRDDNTFGLPDLRMRVPLGAVSETAAKNPPAYNGGKYPLAQQGGKQRYVYQKLFPLAKHTHKASFVAGAPVAGQNPASITVSTSDGGTASPALTYLAKPKIPLLSGLANAYATAVGTDPVFLGDLEGGGGGGIENGSVTISPSGRKEYDFSGSISINADLTKPYLTISFNICVYGNMPQFS